MSMLVLDVKLTAEKPSRRAAGMAWSFKANGSWPGALAAGTGTSGFRVAEALSN
jgi:hypothetical protein